MDEVKQFVPRELLHDTIEQLKPLYARESATLAQHLAEYFFNLSRIDMVLQKKVQVEPQQMKAFRDAVRRLKEEEPIQYITGEAWFLGRSFWIKKGVLIPRQETEELVMHIKKMNRLAQPGILDIGCGSGCIAVSLAMEIPAARIQAWDRASLAVDVTRENAIRHGVNVDVFELDIFTDQWPEDQFDIIVSNPPYVLESEKRDMKTHVLAHEPGEALFVRDQDPLRFYHEILKNGMARLNRGGSFFFEINEAMGRPLVNLLRQHGLAGVEVLKDIHDRDRFIHGRKL